MKDINEIINGITKGKSILLPEGFSKTIAETEFRSFVSDDIIAILELPLTFTHIENDDIFNEVMKIYQSYYKEAFYVIVDKAKKYIQNITTINCTLTYGDEKSRNKQLEKTFFYIENLLKGKNFQDIEIKNYLNSGEPEYGLGEKHIFLEVCYTISKRNDEENKFELFILGNNISYWETDKDNPKVANKIKDLILLDDKPS